MKVPKRRVLIVDKYQLLKDCYCKLSTPPDKFQIVGFFKDIKAAFLSLLKTRPEVIVIVIDGFDEITLRFISKIKLQYPSIKLLVQCDVDDDALIFDLLTVGLAGLCPISRSWEDLNFHLNQIEKGEYPTSSLVTKKIFQTFQLNKHAELSARQSEILRLMLMGATYSTIAERLGISKETAKTHMKNLYKKLDVHTREQALAKAIDERLVLVI